MMGNTPRNHHYVPRGYLKFFANPVSNDVWQTNVYDKVTGKCFSINIENIASQRDYYRVRGREDEFELERFFSEQIEPEIPPVIENIIAFCNLTKNGGQVLTDNIKNSLSKIIITQLLRSPIGRKRNYSIAQKSAIAWMKDFKNVYYEKLTPSQKSAINRITMNQQMYKEFEFDFIRNEKR